MLNILRTEGDISNKELAKKISLSEGPTHKRKVTLFEKKIVKEVQAKIDLSKLGYTYNVMVTCTVFEENVDSLINVLASCDYIKAVYEMDPEQSYTNKRRIAAIAVTKSDAEFINIFGSLFRTLDFKFQFTAYPIRRVVKEDLNITVERPE